MNVMNDLQDFLLALFKWSKTHAQNEHKITILSKENKRCFFLFIIRRAESRIYKQLFDHII